MNRYIEKLEPKIKEIVELTKLEKIEWEKVGDNAFRCVDTDNNISIEISQHNGLVGKAVSIKLYTQSKLVFDYVPGIASKYESFDNMLSQLFDEAEKRNVENVGCAFDIILKTFKNKMNNSNT